MVLKKINTKSDHPVDAYRLLQATVSQNYKVGSKRTAGRRANIIPAIVIFKFCVTRRVARTFLV